ncbi:MAG TPA: NAD(P)/FAD-dependent oxidoreductase [Candidatus Kapabacteria bacterium]|nr:NAD(P)/FAD-dependent oxidoreductase [Candidatus Kapabacteria bacterium]
MAVYDVIVIGAGAAGLFCAIEAGKRGRRVLVIERAEKAGKKILISGGGRCNFTNANITYNSYLSENRDFCRSALSRYTQHDFIELVERYGIEYYEKKDGQLFCNDSARQILDMLLEECKSVNVEVLTGVRFAAKAIQKVGDKFTVETTEGLFEAESVVIATGGASIPKMGATTFGYDVARAFGLSVIEPRPALVPFVFSESDQEAFHRIAGISFFGKVTCGKTSFLDDILFTHRGLSGPAVLQISSYWKEGEAIEIDLLPQQEIDLSRRHKKIPNVLAEYLPQRLAMVWAEHSGYTDYLDQISTAHLNELSGRVHHWKIEPKTTEGLDKAEVTVGGVDTTGLSSKTMEAVSVPGLYFIGEVVDVTGWLGGYNFQWAWSSGWAAGQVC